MTRISLADLLARLKLGGYKITPQRLAICKLILSRRDHPSVETIYYLIKDDFPTMSLATVYKTIILLRDLGLVQEVNVSSNHSRYESNMDLHINFICSKCGNIKDVTSERLNGAWPDIIREINVTPEGQLINIYYTCDKCAPLQNDALDTNR